VVVKDPEIKRKIREAAEAEERESYEHRMPQAWLAALRMSGLATLTPTPSPMRFLSSILGRPKNERPFVLIPVGFPAADATVPDIAQKTIAQVVLIRNFPNDERPSEGTTRHTLHIRRQGAENGELQV